MATRKCKYGERIDGKCPKKPKTPTAKKPCKYGERINGKCPPKKRIKKQVSFAPSPRPSSPSHHPSSPSHHPSSPSHHPSSPSPSPSSPKQQTLSPFVKSAKWTMKISVLFPISPESYDSRAKECFFALESIHLSYKKYIVELRFGKRDFGVYIHLENRLSKGLVRVSKSMQNLNLLLIYYGYPPIIHFGAVTVSNGEIEITIDDILSGEYGRACEGACVSDSDEHTDRIAKEYAQKFVDQSTLSGKIIVRGKITAILQKYNSLSDNAAGAIELIRRIMHTLNGFGMSIEEQESTEAYALRILEKIPPSQEPGDLSQYADVMVE